MPTPQIRIHPFEDDRIEVTPQGGSDPESFFVTNRSNRGILAVEVLHLTQTEQGRIIQQQRNFGSFSKRNLPVVVPPGGRMFIPEPQRWLPEFSVMDIHVDCVIFDDGEVVGPDRCGYMQHLADRRLAAIFVTERFQQARAAGTKLEDAFADFMRNGGHPHSVNG